MRRKNPIEHTWPREPWEVKEVESRNHRTRDLCIFDADSHLVVVVATVRRSEAFSQFSKDTADRIAACVNWCKQ